MAKINRPLALQTPNLHYPIRSVTFADIPLLNQSIWQDRNLDSTTQFIERIIKLESQYRGIGIVAVDDTQPTQSIIAYGQVAQWVKCSEISDLIVTPAYRNQGIGTAMIQYLAGYVKLTAECIELGVAESNPGALALYRRLGFQDGYTLQLDLGQGTEPVIYLQIDLAPFQS